LQPRYLVLLYKLKACNLKTTPSMRGSKVTKRTCIARGRTPVEVWMGTLDEVDICPLIYLVRHIFFMKMEGAFEGIVFLLQ
jgi:hypothetical protein